MKRLARAVFLLLLAGCATPQILEVKTGPGTSYPCGVGGVVCATQHACCIENETCGGEPESVGCPPAMCCYIGPADAVGARPPHPQTPMGDAGP